MDHAAGRGALMGRRVALVAVTVAAVAIAALPLVLTLALGWYHSRVFEGLLSGGAGVFLILVLVYVVWLPATVFGLVFVYDRLGLHYRPAEIKPKRPKRREQLRRRAVTQTVAAEESAQLAAQRAARERSGSRAARQSAGGDAEPGDDPLAAGTPEAPGRPPATDSDAADGRRRPKAG